MGTQNTSGRAKKIAINLLIPCAAIAVLSIVFQVIYPASVSRFWPIALVYFYLITFASQLLNRKKEGEGDRDFLLRFQKLSMAKFVLHLAFIVIYIFINRTDARAFAWVFMVYYVIFTGYELFSRKKTA